MTVRNSDATLNFCGVARRRSQGRSFLCHVSQACWMASDLSHDREPCTGHSGHIICRWWCLRQASTGPSLSRRPTSTVDSTFAHLRQVAERVGYAGGGGAVAGSHRRRRHNGGRVGAGGAAALVRETAEGHREQARDGAAQQSALERREGIACSLGDAQVSWCAMQGTDESVMCSTGVHAQLRHVHKSSRIQATSVWRQILRSDGQALELRCMQGPCILQACPALGTSMQALGQKAHHLGSNSLAVAGAGSGWWGRARRLWRRRRRRARRRRRWGTGWRRRRGTGWRRRWARRGWGRGPWRHWGRRARRRRRRARWRWRRRIWR